jgi:HEAT repeat protein
VTAALQSTTPAERAVALDAVGVARRARWLPAVVTATTDPDPLVRAAALRARLRLEPGSVTSELRALAATPASLGRVLSVLDGRTPSEITAEVIEAASQSDDPVLRRGALDRLALLPTVVQRRVLDRALEDTDVGVRRQASGMAARLGIADATPRLLATLMDGPHERRVEAARRLGAQGDGSAVPALLHVAGRDEGALRDVATAALCALGAIENCASLRTVVASRDVATAGPAIEALVAAGGPEAGPLLAVAVAHPEVEVRLAAAVSVGRIDSPSIRRLLAPLLDDDRSEPRARAAAALCDLEPERADAVVREATRGTHPALRAHLVSALAERHGRMPTPGTGRALTRLAHLADDAHDAPLSAADLPVAIEALRALLTAGPNIDRSLVADAALRHPAPELRFVAARAVAAGEVEDPGAALDDALSDPVVSVRVVAAVARLGPD